VEADALRGALARDDELRMHAVGLAAA
jgi:hypothetical protein